MKFCGRQKKENPNMKLSLEFGPKTFGALKMSTFELF